MEVIQYDRSIFGSRSNNKVIEGSIGRNASLFVE